VCKPEQLRSPVIILRNIYPITSANDIRAIMLEQIVRGRLLTSKVTSSHTTNKAVVRRNEGGRNNTDQTISRIYLGFSMGYKPITVAARSKA
jgi:hypothetical protein